MPERGPHLSAIRPSRAAWTPSWKRVWTPSCSRALATAATAACLVGLLTPATATATDSRPPSALPTTSATATSLSSAELAVLAAPRSREDLIAGMELARIPVDAQQRLQALVARMTDAEVKAMLSATRAPGATADVRAAILSVLDPADYQCDDRTALDEYVAQLLSEADLPGLVGLLYMINYGLLDIQTYEALLFAHARPNTFGAGDEYAKPLAKAMRQARSFWDVDTGDVVLGAMDADLWVRLKGDSAEAQAARRRAATVWATWGRLAIGPTDVDGTPMNTEYGLEIIGLFAELLDAPYQASLDHGRNDLFTLLRQWGTPRHPAEAGARGILGQRPGRACTEAGARPALSSGDRPVRDGAARPRRTGAS